MREDKLKRRDELRAKNRRKSRDILPTILIGIMFLLIAILSYTYYLTTPVDKDNQNKVIVEIKESYGSSIIADKLYEQKLIKSSNMFKVYARLHPNSNFYVGNFELSQDMNMANIFEKLTDKSKSNSGVNLSIIEGDNIEKIAVKVEKVTDISADTFLSKVNDEKFIAELKNEYPDLITDSLDNPNIKYKLEGYLYPAAYNIDNSNKSNVETLIKQMIKTTNDRVIPQYNKNSKVWSMSGVNKNINIHQYVTMASILEKESTADTDNKSIAGVFLNRLKVNMQLQTDPTVYYSVGKNTGALTVQDLANTNPYNTYTNLGLPPGPIAMPSQKSYEALNNATQHDYLYFLTDKQGKAYFAKTYAEHEELARKYVEGYISTN
ncbi:endolytic transglycosylase MltG [Gemella sp. GH3]|uniref:endolytic transglycosylase MltG n=1 Tax=unclassified Gemella TaxID=2624949 RepID=UPI0015D06406|nr:MULTISPECIES: endolytic transglycosylase MltG [unclassified Gemella]MBF0713209.1 endolytic transglycosylase MltG [Gemella sp. GH3.1]NYS50161.1 endolytic transglycosylase MltG [Gemella sp. GH3]